MCSDPPSFSTGTCMSWRFWTSRQSPPFHQAPVRYKTSVWGRNSFSLNSITGCKHALVIHSHIHPKPHLIYLICTWVHLFTAKVLKATNSNFIYSSITIRCPQSTSCYGDLTDLKPGRASLWRCKLSLSLSILLLMKECQLAYCCL